ncbi:MAG: homoserine dehydrogenase [Aminobacterium sp.]|jgi:homoserine dehydrogenase|uniref:homoserine dehydrogenase n=1 Tax=Aminobacterium sp. TaxID=1872491 RepID=UPI001BD0C89A|nr:homoserine dehydrogenase [Aminobacterium sp.]MEA4877672.1 homoserine dehydrogenase [Aminobacterium sp.]
MKVWGLCFIGFGNVGQGLARILVREEENLFSHFGFRFKTIAVVTKSKGSRVDPNGLSLSKLLDEINHDQTLGPCTITPEEAICLPEVDIVIDVTPTNLKNGEPGLSITKKALQRGSHVVTSNKGPASLALKDLLKIASEHKSKYRFEGTVLSGTPAINLARESMAGCHITEVQGIVNGTTNYILTRMEEGLEYDDALKEAQALGYAEANPEGDVDGWDAAVKVQIIASVFMGKYISLKDISRVGISGLKRKDIEKALSQNERIKLVAKIVQNSGQIFASVAPVSLPFSHPLSGVNGATNAITLTTDNLKDVTIIGPGAGREETGQALLSDIISIVTH